MSSKYKISQNQTTLDYLKKITQVVRDIDIIDIIKKKFSLNQKDEIKESIEFKQILY